MKFSGDFQDPAQVVDLRLVKKKKFDMPPMSVSMVFPTVMFRKTVAILLFSRREPLSKGYSRCGGILAYILFVVGLCIV